MKIILVGATGTIGSAVYQLLSERHEVVSVGRSSGDYQVDISDRKSINDLYTKIGVFDALACTAGNVHFAPLEQFSEENYYLGLNDKLMGQVNLVMLGLKYIRDKGSFTLISGLLNDDPILQGVSASMVNGALEGFVRASAIEMPRNIRINLVSPTVIKEALPVYGSFFPGCKAIAASDAALGFVKSIEGLQTGRIYRLGWSRDNY